MLLPHFPPDLGFFNSAVHLKIHVSLTDSFHDLFHGTFWGNKIKDKSSGALFFKSLFVKIIVKK